MVDLQPLFTRARTLVAQAIATSGCTVRLETRTDGANLGDPPTTTVHGVFPALVGPAADILATQALPGLDVKATDWRVILNPTTTPPKVGDWAVIETSPHPHLQDQEARITGFGVDPSGSALMVYARPVPA